MRLNTFKQMMAFNNMEVVACFNNQRFQAMIHIETGTDYKRRAFIFHNNPDFVGSVCDYLHPKYKYDWFLTLEGRSFGNNEYYIETTDSLGEL